MQTVIPFNQVDSKALTKKWEKWLKGVRSDERRSTLAILLENQHKYNKNQLLKEATVAGDAGAFQKVILPVIRRVFPRLVAPELVGVQPMTGPTGLAVFLKYYYEGVTGSPVEVLAPGGNLDGRRISFREYQSSAYLKSGALAVLGGAPVYQASFNVSTLPGSVTWSTFSGAAKVYFDITCTNAGDIGRAIIEGVNTANWNSTTPVWSWSVVKDWYTLGLVPATYNHSIAIGATASHVGTVYTIECDFHTAQYTNDANLHLRIATEVAGNVPTFNAIEFPGEAATDTRALFTDAVFLNAGCPILTNYSMENQTPSSMAVKFETHPIVAEDYKLQATWSLEASQDVSALHNESLEEILSNLLTQELMNEIDYLIVRDLYNMAALTATWNKYPGTQGLGTGAPAATAVPAYRGSIREYWETLVFLMNDVSNSIHTRILRGPANFAVISPDVSTILESMPEFKSSSINELDTEVGVVPVGTLTSKYKLYKDARLPKGTMLMGFKGADARNTGYIYAPYIPATLSPVIWNPTTYANQRMIMTRFGRTTLLDGQYFYARIAVTETNLATSDWTTV